TFRFNINLPKFYDPASILASRDGRGIISCWRLKSQGETMAANGRPPRGGSAPRSPRGSGRRAARGRGAGAGRPRGDRLVVEGEDAVVQDLESPGALAGDQDGVAGLGVGQGRLDGAPAVRFDPHPARPAEPREQVVEDLVRVLGARVVGGEGDA